MVHNLNMQHIVHIITSLHRGGAERTLVRLITNTDPKLVQHSVICLLDSGPLLEEIQPHLKHFIVSPWNFFKLLKTLKEWNPDVVQTWMYYSNILGGIVARIAGIKKVFWNIRITKLEWKYHDAKSFISYAMGSLLSHFIPTKIIYCSQSGIIFHESKGYSKKKSIFIPNGIDAKAYAISSAQKSSARKQLHIDTKTFVIGMLARFDPQKDFQTFFEAAAVFVIKHPNTKFVLAGNQVTLENESLLKLISPHIRKNVLLLGNQANVKEIYACLDLFTLSSMAEGFPNVIAEAMACSIPVVASDVGDAKFIIEETGWVIPPRDPIALTAAWEAALKNDLKAKGIAASKRIEQTFSLQKMIDAYTNVYLKD